MMSTNNDDISIYLRSLYLTHREYIIRVFGQHLQVFVTSNPCSVETWINRSLEIHRNRFLYPNPRSFIVGLGIQWRSSQFNRRRPATIQICIGHRVLIFQIIRSSIVPTALAHLLSNRCITFVGYNIEHDCSLLRSCYGLVVARAEELRIVSGMGRKSKEKMAEKFLGFHGIENRWEIRTSKWDAAQLSDDQVQFAAVGVYISFLLGLRLVDSFYDYLVPLFRRR